MELKQGLNTRLINSNGTMPVSDRRRSPFWKWWITVFLIFAAIEICWSLATPLFASPDEPTQVIKAVATLRGEFIGKPFPGPIQANTIVRVPKTFVDGSIPVCFAHKPTIPAGCAPVVHASGQVVTATTYVGRYPPLYYLLSGWPSLFSSSTWVIYAMRFASGLATAAMIALAFAVAARWSRSRLLPTGIALAAVPSLLFLGSVVNPSGLEIAAGLATWTCGAVLVFDGGPHPPKGLVVCTALSASVFALIRGLSPFWVVLIGLLLLLVAGRDSSREWFQDFGIRVLIVVVSVVGLLAVAWILFAHALAFGPIFNAVSAKAPPIRVFSAILGESWLQVGHMIGRFGWNDTSAPALTLFIWMFALGAFIGLGLSAGSYRLGVVLLVTILLVIIVPALLTLASSHQDGQIWQARYGLPFAVGVPILASAGIRDLRLSKRLGIFVALGVGIAQIATFIEVLQRYVEGLNSDPYSGFLYPFAKVPNGWVPPLPPLVLTGLFSLCMMCAVVMFIKMTLRAIPILPLGAQGASESQIGSDGRDHEILEDPDSEERNLCEAESEGPKATK